MNIVVNKCYGGFGLSHEAVMKYAEKKGMKLYPYVDKIDKNLLRVKDAYIPLTDKIKEEHSLIYYFTKPLVNGKWPNENNEKTYFYEREIERNDPALVEVVKELGNKANGSCARLEIVEIPDDVKWEIDEYDGQEWVQEQCRKWS